MSISDTLEGYVEERPAPVARVAPAKVAKREVSGVPPDLREADALLVRYGKWAQDRYQKRRCASAEGRYIAPPTPGEAPMVPFMSDFNAMKVQHALQVVPMQYRRVLQAFYIPQAKPHHAVRRELRIGAALWERSRLEGLRQFWNIYRLRYLTA